MGPMVQGRVTDTVSHYYAPACKRGGTMGVSDQEEMDAGKPTVSGPAPLVVAQTGTIPDTYRKPPSTRERERATLTQSTPRMYMEQSKGNTRDTDRDLNAHILIYIYMYLQKSDTTPVSSRTKQVQLQQ